MSPSDHAGGFPDDKRRSGLIEGEHQGVKEFRGFGISLWAVGPDKLKELIHHLERLRVHVHLLP